MHHVNNFKALDFQSYKSSLPASALQYLERTLDWDHEGVDIDLNEVADHMLDWEERLSTLLGMTPIEIHDIKLENPTNLRLQRLARWCTYHPVYCKSRIFSVLIYFHT